MTGLFASIKIAGGSESLACPAMGLLVYGQRPPPIDICINNAMMMFRGRKHLGQIERKR
jgi:hypothetical protein